MKHSICALLVVSLTATAAEEPKQPAEPPAAVAPVVPPSIAPPGLGWLLGEFPWRLPDGSLRLPDGLAVTPTIPLDSRFQRNLNGPCYFIRTLRPVVPDEDAQRSGFIPLQARVLGTAREPSCVSGGTFQPLIPVQRLILRKAD